MANTCVVNPDVVAAGRSCVGVGFGLRSRTLDTRCRTVFQLIGRSGICASEWTGLGREPLRVSIGPFATGKVESLVYDRSLSYVNLFACKLQLTVWTFALVPARSTIMFAGAWGRGDKEPPQLRAVACRMAERVPDTRLPALRRAAGAQLTQ